METFKYLFLSRPADSFSCPMENFVAFHPDEKYRGFGIVEYSKELPIDQAIHFSLAPMFLDHYDGKEVQFFEDLVGKISVGYNNAGQVFFTIMYDDCPTVMVWHQFLKNLLEQRYKLVS